MLRLNGKTKLEEFRNAPTPPSVSGEPNASNADILQRFPPVAEASKRIDKRLQELTKERDKAPTA